MLFPRYLTPTSFNPRVLPRGRDSIFRELGVRLLFQSTRPPARTRTTLKGSLLTPHVSIHASSREDATKNAPVTLADVLFQSTRPRGRTRLMISWKQLRKKVSIHASSREDATHVLNNF